MQFEFEVRPPFFSIFKGDLALVDNPKRQDNDDDSDDEDDENCDDDESYPILSHPKPIPCRHAIVKEREREKKIHRLFNYTLMLKNLPIDRPTIVFQKLLTCLSQGQIWSEIFYGQVFSRQRIGLRMAEVLQHCGSIIRLSSFCHNWVVHDCERDVIN